MMDEQKKRFKLRTEISKRFAVIIIEGEFLPESRKTCLRRVTDLSAPQSSRIKSRTDQLSYTRQLIEKIFALCETIFVITRSTGNCNEHTLSDLSPENVIVQPKDKGTTPAILYSLLRLKKLNPEAVVVVFNAGFINFLSLFNENDSTKRIMQAAVFARRQPGLMLFGTRPQHPTPCGDWIEPDRSYPISEALKVWRVRSFHPSPISIELKGILNRQAFLTVPVIIGSTSAFLRVIRVTAGKIYTRFKNIETKINTPDERQAVEQIYCQNFERSDFSKDILARTGEKLRVFGLAPERRNPNDFDSADYSHYSEKTESLIGNPACGARKFSPAA